MLMEKIAFFIWTAGFAGLVPVAPGTAGSVVGVVLLILVRAAARNDWIELLVLVMVMAVGTWSASVAERHYCREDPGEVVVDEVAGMMLTLLWLPSGWIPFLIGFLAFRFFDISPSRQGSLGSEGPHGSK